jgi:hypothetical protein
MKDISLYYLFDGKDIFLGPEMFKCVPLLCFMWLYNFLDSLLGALYYYKITTNIEKRSSSASAIYTRQNKTQNQGKGYMR